MINEKTHHIIQNQFINKNILQIFLLTVYDTLILFEFF